MRLGKSPPLKWWLKRYRRQRGGSKGHCDPPRRHVDGVAFGDQKRPQQRGRPWRRSAPDRSPTRSIASRLPPSPRLPLGLDGRRRHPAPDWLTPNLWATGRYSIWYDGGQWIGPRVPGPNASSYGGWSPTPGTSQRQRRRDRRRSGK